MSDVTTLRVYETRTLLQRAAFTGSVEQVAQIVTGSRMLVSLVVTAIDPATTVTVHLDNTFTTDLGYDTIDTFGTSAVGRVKRIVSDFHNIFRFRVVITGGNATFALGASIFDNAMTTRIENAMIDVDLSHTVDPMGNFDSVRIGDGTDLLNINPDGSINASVSIDPADSLLAKGTEDGTTSGIQHVLKVGSDLNLRVKDENALALLTDIESNTQAIATSVDQIEPKLDSVVNELQDSNASLASIDAKLSSPIATTIGDLNANKDDVAIAGTENGLATGTIRHFVNNRRLQILSAHDRQQVITYADFGTKDERVISITYTSPTFAGISATKTIAYTLIGNKYRRDSISWSVV